MAFRSHNRIFAAVMTKTEQRIKRRFQKALVQYGLIDDGDRILVGLSGGKDSLCLLELLARRSKIHRPSFKVEALHVRMDNIEYETDTSYLQSFCNQLDIPLHIVSTRFDEKSAPGKEKPACFLCSWARRKQLFNMAQQLGCNKIALGHHQDDIIHTALMNLCFEGQFATMPVKLKMEKMPLTIIRPLCLEQECDIIDFATLKGYKKQLKRCPNERRTSRTEAAQLFQQMEKINSEARFSIWNALEKAGKLTSEPPLD